jgi:hypothetical protein
MVDTPQLLKLPGNPLLTPEKRGDLKRSAVAAKSAFFGSYCGSYKYTCISVPMVKLWC